MKDYYDPPDYPENPPWTMFFDGPLYEKYKEFMANKDFSKILLTSKLKLANQKDNIPDVPEVQVGIDWWSMDHDDTGKDNHVSSDTYNTVSDTFYKKSGRSRQEEKRRTRRTRAIILLIILVLLAVSLGTALIIHYFFVPKDDDIATAQVNISFSGNTSILGMTTDITSLDNIGGQKSTTLGLLTTTATRADEESHVTGISDRSGPLFEDTKNVTEPSTIPVTKITNVTMKTSVTTTGMKEPETEFIDPFDFFSMDENMTTTTSQPNQTTATGVSPKTTTYIETTLPSTSPSTTRTTDATTTTVMTEKSIESTVKITSTTEMPSTETSPNFTTFGISTITSEHPTLESTTTQDNTTTSSPLTTTLQQTTKTITVPSTNQQEVNNTTSLLTTIDAFTKHETTVIDETTLTSVTPSTSPEPTASRSDTSVVPSTSTGGSTEPYNVSEENTTLDIGTEMVSTTQEITTTASNETTFANDLTTTEKSTTIARSTTELITSTVSPITTDSTAKTTTLQNTTSADIASTTLEETTVETTTTLIHSTTTESLPRMETEDETAYKTETTRIICRVTELGQFTTLSIKEDKYWSPVEVILNRVGSTQWSYSKTDRHHVTHDLRNMSGSDLKQLTVILEIQDVQCNDAGSFTCDLQTRFHNVTKTAQLTVVGRPDKKVTLQLGPSIIEERAFRITAIWQAGYPIPWSNMSWMALDARNQTYNLEDYGEYRDYELKVDHNECQTFLESAIVIFPQVHLNDTTVIVKPNLESTKYFVDDSMREYLRQVEYGVEKVSVIPLNYCPSVSKEEKEISIPHPYSDCTKFIWCLPGNLFVQQCPTGTCFYEKWQECL